MAEPNTNDVRTATNASNTTRYFHLPLFIATDKPSWLVDWNGAMGDIDNILQDIATASEGAVADVATIQTQIDALNQTIPNLEALVNTAVSDVAAMQTTVASHETRMDAIETDLITQNNLIKTLSDAVTAMQATVATLNNRVQACETLVSGLDTDVSAISTELSQIRTQMTTINGSISSLDTRVTALENAQPGGGGSMPVFSELNFNQTTVPLSDISTSGSTVFTAPSDGYVIIRNWISEQVASAGTPASIARSLETQINGITVCEAYFNFTTGIAGAYDDWAVSGLLRVKADDTITAIRTAISGDGNANIYINFAPLS